MNTATPFTHRGMQGKGLEPEAALAHDKPASGQTGLNPDLPFSKARIQGTILDLHSPEGCS